MNNRRAQMQNNFEGPDRVSSRGWRRPAILVAVAAVALGAAATRVRAQQAQVMPQPNVEHVIGLEGIKPGYKAALTVQGNELVFAWDRTKATIPIASILDIFTSDDTQQIFRGSVGSAMKAGVPYGGGRVMSLFTQATQVMTVEYRDSNGGFHGAVFIFTKGKATEAKKALVAAGAHASIPPEEPAKEEKKP
ncbi:MAG TPA: hypothetical protein VL099_16220 [Candidatus Binatia bacterium]|nr:hypothetical protein [Candidatus Binatia bacterium]